MPVLAGPPRRPPGAGVAQGENGCCSVSSLATPHLAWGGAGRMGRHRRDRAALPLPGDAGRSLRGGRGVCSPVPSSCSPVPSSCSRAGVGAWRGPRFRRGLSPAGPATVVAAPSCAPTEPPPRAAEGSRSAGPARAQGTGAEARPTEAGPLSGTPGVGEVGHWRGSRAETLWWSSGLPWQGGAGRCRDGSVTGPGSCSLPAPVKLAITDHLGASWFFLLGISAGSVSRSACSESHSCQGWSRDGTPLIAARLRHVVITACPRLPAQGFPLATTHLGLSYCLAFKSLKFQLVSIMELKSNQACIKPLRPLCSPTQPPPSQDRAAGSLRPPHRAYFCRLAVAAGTPADGWQRAGLLFRQLSRPHGWHACRHLLAGAGRLNRDPRLPRGRVVQEAAEGCPCATAALLGDRLVALSTLCQHLGWPQSGSLQPKAFLGGSSPFPRAWRQGEMGKGQLGPGLEGLSTAGGLQCGCWCCGGRAAPTLALPPSRSHAWLCAHVFFPN